MKQIEQRAINAFWKYARIVGRGVLNSEYKPADEEIIIEYRQKKSDDDAEATVKIVGGQMRIFGPNSSIINFLERELQK